MSEKISVLIPVYNRELYIKKSLTSIINQTYTNLEILVYDDGSTDGTVGIIKDLASKDRRIKLIVGDKNRGVGHARNVLLSKCHTAWACLHDSDDISLPTRIAKQRSVLKKYKGKALVFCEWAWLTLHSQKGWITKPPIEGVKASPTLMFPVRKHITYDECLVIGGEDWDWIKKMQVEHYTAIVPETLYYLRYHDDRIGYWKRLLRAKLSQGLINRLGYAELVQYYKEHYL